MIDRDLLISKASAAKYHIERIKNKKSIDLETFLNDNDCQDIILFNFQMAIQNCMDVASHIISQQSLGVAGSYNEMFYLLEEKGFIDKDITEKMVKAVGFRNLMVHEYTKLDLTLVYNIVETGTKGLLKFLKSILSKTDAG